MSSMAALQQELKTAHETVQYRKCRVSDAKKKNLTTVKKWEELLDEAKSRELKLQNEIDSLVNHKLKEVEEEIEQKVGTCPQFGLKAPSSKRSSSISCVEESSCKKPCADASASRHGIANLESDQLSPDIDTQFLRAQLSTKSTEIEVLKAELAGCKQAYLSLKATHHKWTMLQVPKIREHIQKRLHRLATENKELVSTMKSYQDQEDEVEVLRAQVLELRSLADGLATENAKLRGLSTKVVSIQQAVALDSSSSDSESESNSDSESESN
jgi:hypothetical protein